MKTKELWAQAMTVNPLGTKVVDWVQEIQLDALREASLIASAQKVPSGTKDWNDGYHLAVKHATDAILARIKEIEK